MTNKKLHTRFLLVPKSTTPNTQRRYYCVELSVLCAFVTLNKRLLTYLLTYVCAYVCMSALLNKNRWTYHHQTWQVDSRVHDKSWLCAYVCMSALLNKNRWTYHHQTWQVDSRVHDKSWSPILFEVKRSYAKVGMTLHSSDCQSFSCHNVCFNDF